jgi:PKD repeat protein
VTRPEDPRTPATATTYFNDGIGPDPYPNPDGAFPFTVTDSETHAYQAAGIYELKLIVRDDDGGTPEILLVNVIV